MKPLNLITLFAMSPLVMHPPTAVGAPRDKLSAVVEQRRSTEAAAPRMAPSENRVLTQPAERVFRDTRAVVKETARANIENSVQRSTEGRLAVTSRDREGLLKSPAHDRGAVDFSVKRSQDPHRDAQKIASALGPGYKSIVEQPRANGDTHTAYSVSDSKSKQVNSHTYTAPPRASAPHIHVQPQYEVKLPRPRDDSNKFVNSRRMEK